MSSKTIGLLLASLSVSAVFAADVTVKSGITDWTADASYVGEKAPSAGDNVIVPANTAVTLDAADTASWTLVESLTRLIPQAVTSVLTVRVDTATCSGGALITTPFAVDSSKDFGDFRSNYSGLGTFVKVGDGNLQLGGAESRFMCNNLRMDYDTTLLVKEGTLTLPQNMTTGRGPVHGPTTIEKGATVVGITVHPDYTTKAWPQFSFYKLFGEGTLTSESSRPVSIQCIHGRGTSVFAGKLSGTLSGVIMGDLVLTGTESDTTGLFQVYYNHGWNEAPALAGAWWGGYLSVAKVGMKGEPSSIGSHQQFAIYNYGGGLVYLGTGETTDKTIYYNDGSGGLWGHAFIDGGANGGLVWAGPWEQQQNSATKTSRMYLTGSNTTACVMSGAFADTVATDDKVSYPIYVIKRGTGTWKMADNANRTCGGGYAIENGTLQFESIAEKGTVCSLGTATNLTAPYSGRDIENHRVSYAYLLGTNTTEGTMEFVGLNGGQCSTRPVAVNGKGRFKVSGSGAFSFAGISAINGAAEIALDTDRASGVIFGGLHDGADGALKVVKEGSGTVTLNTACDFTGGLEVKAGSVVINGTGKAAPSYQWFRWNLTEKGVFCERYKDRGWSTAWPNTPCLQMEEFAMFDANGKRIDKGLKFSELQANFDQMPTGTVAQETPADVAPITSKITTFFDGGAGSVSGSWGGIMITSGVWPFCRQDTPSKWFKFVVHLPEGANPAASYDMAGFFSVSEDNATRMVTAVKIEGSVDGVNWEPVVENTTLEIPEDKVRWYANTNATLVSIDGAAYYLKDHVGYEMRGTATNVVAGIASIAAPVSVASGTSLVADGAVTLSSLKLSASANGTLSGVTLAASGTLDITDYAGGANVAVPVTFTNVTGVDNLKNWTLTVNGTARKNYSVAIGSDGTVTLLAPSSSLLLW